MKAVLEESPSAPTASCQPDLDLSISKTPQGFFCGVCSVHDINLAVLRKSTLDWSFMCPGILHPALGERRAEGVRIICEVLICQAWFFIHTQACFMISECLLVVLHNRPAVPAPVALPCQQVSFNQASPLHESECQNHACIIMQTFARQHCLIYSHEL